MVNATDFLIVLIRWRLRQQDPAGQFSVRLSVNMYRPLMVSSLFVLELVYDARTDVDVCNRRI